MNVLRFLSGVLGNAAGLFLFLAPMVTFKRIISSRSTEQFSGVPYVMTFLNCIAFTWYGLPFVSRNNLLLSTINGIGGVIEFTYVVIFLIYAQKKERTKVMGLFALITTLFLAIAFVSLLALHGNTRKFFCGVAAALFSTIMYASPLSVMVPNGLGTGLGIAQLILYAIYCKNKSHTQNIIKDDFTEMDPEKADQAKKPDSHHP
ncbi:bidirectional sugar transporter SWEET1-like isoform X2 [Rhodamnia argentea]|uniref:Bidirectional sugar transporter SWEET1-like isoform X2 n=1 Tax=Rhodamnia argentea TaxID=178133 RepID=A0A8B8QAH9_9MYRT|nr:bidirectional sugar transporter SWEET1-like isoform X2 [Rhodamnia argentea]